MKVIVTLAIYRNSEEAYSPSSFGVVRHYMVEFNDYCAMLKEPVPQFAIQSAIAYAFDEYYFEEGWKDVIVHYVNHRLINCSTSSVVVSPCNAHGKKYPFYNPRSFNVTNDDITRKPHDKCSKKSC